MCTSNNRAIVVAFITYLFFFSQGIAKEQDGLWSKPDLVALQKWQEMRFGIFIHWGPVSLTGHEIGWSRGKQIPIEKYDNLYKKFNPIKFNANQWVALAKTAGAKYIVFTTKHHDGFCLWDTKFTEYDIMNSPYNRDIVKELSDACKQQGIAFGAYHSVCDWYHPDFPSTSPAGKTKRNKSDITSYRRYFRSQVTELIKNYGPFVTLWFDVPHHFNHKDGSENIRVCRALQADILVNDRAGGNRWREVCGDYSTPEQKIGTFQMDRPWESCMTISARNQWAWGGREDGVKSLAECLKMLICCTGGDGNMLLNIGPKPTGEIAEDQANRLKEIGAWLSKYGESIYATRGGPYKPSDGVVSTRKGNTIYLHVLAWPTDVVRLPALPAKILSSHLLGGGKVIVKQTGSSVDIKVPKSNRHKIDTIVVLTLDKSAIEILPIDVPKLGRE